MLKSMVGWMDEFKFIHLIDKIKWRGMDIEFDVSFVNKKNSLGIWRV
jgi:hypothetical protein